VTIIIQELTEQSSYPPEQVPESCSTSEAQNSTKRQKNKVLWRCL